MRPQLAIGQAAPIRGIARHRICTAIVAHLTAVLLNNSVAAVGAFLTIQRTAATGAVILTIIAGFASFTLRNPVTAVARVLTCHRAIVAAIICAEVALFALVRLDYGVATTRPQYASFGAESVAACIQSVVT